MSERNFVKPSQKNISRLKILMIIGYAVIIALAVAVVSILAVHKTDKVLTNKVSSMASSLTVQMKLNINSYISRMETIATLAFASEEAYTYDATATDNDEYESLNTEKIISDKLYSLCIMENFVDYGIVYRNNRTVGKVSNGTVNLFGDRIFTDLSAMISRQRTSDGWGTGYNDDFKRIYYVKQIHENAILVLSFYTTELENVFDNPEALDDMTIRLTDSDYNIIYSSERYELGLPLPDEIAQRTVGHNSATIMDNDYLISKSACGDEWFVICSIPTQIILDEKNEMTTYIYMIALIAAFLAIIIGACLSVQLTNPVNSAFTNLNDRAMLDQLTGILNKKSFEDLVEEKLSTCPLTEDHALMIVDIANFKGVNDTLGHAYGDKVLSELGNTLKHIFTSDELIGRIGGDEFCILLNASPKKNMLYNDYVKQKCEELCDAFRRNYTGDDGKYKISGSIGVSMFPADGSDFKELYSASDKALYTSKRSGKDTFTFFTPDMNKEA